jgi:hypothetical protein
MVEKYRLAWCKLMLTPAPNGGYVRWKRTQLYAENYKFTGFETGADRAGDRSRCRMAGSASRTRVQSQALEFGARVMSELTPQHVLADLFGSADFPAEILLDPAHAAEIVIRRLCDAGFRSSRPVNKQASYHLSGPPRFNAGRPDSLSGGGSHSGARAGTRTGGSVDSGKRLFRPIVAGDQGAGLRSCVRPAPIYDCK